MSDCSTNAFKVPKGMCSCSMPGAPDELDGVIEHLDELLSEDEFPCDECRAEHDRLREWLVCLQSLAQRYQQLEQVVKEMFGFMNLIFDDIGIEPTFTSAVTHKAMSLPRFREQLEALGVSLDG